MVDSEAILRRLGEIEARAAKATPGPWIWEGYSAGWGIVYAKVLRKAAGRYQICDFATRDDAAFIACARESVSWLCETVRRLVAENAAMREALEVIMQTANKLGVYEVAEDALGADAGRDLLDRLRKLEAVAKAAREYLHDIDAPILNQPTIYQYEPGEDKSWRLRKALAALEK